MKRITSIFAVMIATLVLVGGCQESAKRPGGESPGVSVAGASNAGLQNRPTQDAGQAKFKFERNTHDFGVIGAGTRNKCEFAFKNIGDSVLRIEQIETQCGCTVPTLSKKAYGPGESGVLVVEYHAQTQPGSVNKLVTLVVSDEDNPRIPLTIKAKVVRKVDCKPEQLQFALDSDEPVVHEIVLESLDGVPFSVESLRDTADCITADFDPSAKATRFVLKARVDPKKLKGNLNGSLVIALTHPECPSVQVHFSVLAKYTVTPPAIAVLDAKPSDVVRKKISVLSNYKRAFEIDKILSDNGRVKMLSKKAIRDGHQIVVEISPPDSHNQVSYDRGSFSIRLSDGVVLPINYQIIYVSSGSGGS